MEYEADVSAQLKALGDPTRHKIVMLLLERQHCPRSLALTLGISDSAVSQQMAVLRKAGLVQSYRHGYHIHYMLDKPAFERLAAKTRSWADAIDSARECHSARECNYRLDDGSDGCLYRSFERGREQTESQEQDEAQEGAS